jgi:prepilin-type N-terminal cleavage/methylation domain-containing protein
MKIALKSPAVRAVGIRAESGRRHAGSEGFTLVESLMAIFVLAVGLMFVGPMMFHSIGLTTLARSKDAAGLAATNELEALALKYRTSPTDADLTLGEHGPAIVEVVNPSDGSKLNRYNVRWTVSQVPDVRAGKVLRAVRVAVAVTPLGSGTRTNVQTGLNKVIHASTIFSFRSP